MRKNEKQSEETDRRGVMERLQSLSFGKKLGLLIAVLVCVSILGMLWVSSWEQEQKQIVVTAHRGVSVSAPENTIPAFKLSIQKGAEYAELDVQMTKDGVAVLTHDTNLRRCTGLNANVYDLTYAEVRELDAGKFFSVRFAGTKIPTLDEVLRLCKGRIKLNIEIKPSEKTPTLEAEVVRLIQKYGFEEDCTVTSKSRETLAKVKSLEPRIRTGLITTLGFLTFQDGKEIDFFSIDNSAITVLTVWQAHLRGKTVSAWTVDQEEDIERMIRLGVDDIITNDPERVQQALRSRQKIEEETDLWDILEEVYPEEDTDSSVQDDA